MAKFKLIFLLYVSLAFAASNANTFGRRDHADLGRLLKKRAPLDILGGQSSAQGQQTPSTSPAIQSSQASSAAAQTTPANSVSVQTTPGVVSASAHPSTASGNGLSSSVVDGLSPSQSGTTSSAAPATTSSSSNRASSAPQTSSQDQASQTSASSATRSTLYLTASNVPTATQTNAASSSSGISHAATTVLIVIAASVGAAVIVWTIIRKWKFRPSSDFEGRMQPIDWQPGGNDEATDFHGQHRPLSRASSFHSGSGLADDQMRGPIGGHGTPALNPIPDHDFTAGPAHLAPVGGYADLARGPSSQSMMQEPLGQAPSINRPVHYDPYAVPLHHGYNGY